MNPLLYSIGCLGRISSFEETSDGRFLISLDGLVRFRVRQELEMGMATGGLLSVTMIHR